MKSIIYTSLAAIMMFSNAFAEYKIQYNDSARTNTIGTIRSTNTTYKRYPKRVYIDRSLYTLFRTDTRNSVITSTERAIRPMSSKLYPYNPEAQERLKGFKNKSIKMIMTGTGKEEFTMFENTELSVAMPTSFVYNSDTDTFMSADGTFEVSMTRLITPCGGAKFDSCTERLFGEYTRSRNVSMPFMAMLSNHKYYNSHFQNKVNYLGAVKQKSFVDVYSGTFTAWYAMADMDGSLIIITMNGPSKTAKHYLVEGKKIVDTLQILNTTDVLTSINTPTIEDTPVINEDTLTAQEFIIASSTELY